MLKKKIIKILVCIFLTTILLSSCSKPKASLASEVVGWSNRVSFGSNISTIVQDINNVKHEAKIGDYYSVPTLCAVLGQDAQNFYTDSLPSPSEKLNFELSKALQITYKASYTCYRVGDLKDHSQLEAQINAMNSALVIYAKAQELVASYVAQNYS